MTDAERTLRIGGARYRIAGVAPDDPYFAGLHDGFADGFDRFCAVVLRPDDVCLDVGANIGVMSLLLAGRVPQGRVVAIEAAPGVGRKLAENVAGSGLGNIVVVHAAIGAGEGTVRFREQSAYGHIADDGVAVPLRTLDSVVAESGLDRVDFIKIDVEGHEFPILRAADGLIARFEPVVFLEFNAWCQVAHSAVNPVEFATWLLGRFSHVYRVRELGSRMTLQRIPPDGALAFAHDVMVHDGAFADLVATNRPERVAALAGPPVTVRPEGLAFRLARGVLRRAGFELRRL